MNHKIAVTRLHFSKRAITFLTPAAILLTVVLVSLIVALAIQRFDISVSDPEYIEGFKQNTGVLYSLPGFLGYLGVQAVSTTFPFAMALGTTRRSYALGTALYYGLQSAYVAVVAVVLYWIEKLTGHWGVGAYVFDTNGVGSGNELQVFATVFAIAFIALCVGGAFGAVFLRFGPKGPIIVAIGLVILFALLLLATLPWLSHNFTSITRWDYLAVALGLAVVAMLGLYGALRRTMVR